ncbi:MAG: GGDEF domain-containing protein [Pirellulales bacterium]|nr:GGDEF domain-containing protein [Pirellulales bacterium]
MEATSGSGATGGLVGRRRPGESALYFYVVLLLVLVALVNLVVGWLLGRLWPSGRSTGPESYALRSAARELADQVASVNEDLHRHQGRIREVNQELLATPSDESRGMQSLVASVAEIVRINAGLQDKLSAAEEALKEQGRQIDSWITEARTDPLTRLPNRRAFDDALARRLAEWRRTESSFAVMLIDADHFKAVNDRYGHSMGDFVLRRLAEVLEVSVRKMDLVARIGGEEFAVILPGAAAPNASRAAEHCLSAVGGHEFRRGDTALRLTVSIGIAPVKAGDDGESLVRRADEALYSAKHAGRNCIYLHDGQECQHVGAIAGDADIACTQAGPVAAGAQVPSPASGDRTLGAGAGLCRVPGPEDYRDLDTVCRDLRARAAQLFTA